MMISEKMKAVSTPSAALLSLIFGMAVTTAGVAQDPAEREALLKRVNAAMHDEAKTAQAIKAGRERTLLCSECHGVDGNSVSPEIPNLAGQNPTYLLQQVEKFADGRRRNFVMQSLARSFSMEDKVNLAVYFSEQEVKVTGGDPALAAQGKPIFEQNCQQCHGHDGRGEEGYARIAGQRITYVINTLKRFRANARGEGEERDRVRTSRRMEQQTQSLTDEQIQALAHYVHLLGK